MDATLRENILPGIRVAIVLKQDQRTGNLTEGVVSRILTKSSTHPCVPSARLHSKPQTFSTYTSRWHLNKSLIPHASPEGR
ncbi:MAG: YwbE family protein [Spirochaetia bacterium]|nr:YwbE family protein [Spirochaetia bacterium]